MSDSLERQFSLTTNSFKIENKLLPNMALKAIASMIETSFSEVFRLHSQQIVGNCYRVIKPLERQPDTIAYLVEDLDDREHSIRILELVYDRQAWETVEVGTSSQSLAGRTNSTLEEQGQPFTEEAFYRRLTLLKKLSTHVQIPKVLDGTIEDGRYYLVYEYFDGEILASAIERGVLSEAEIVSLLQDTARICDFAIKNRLLDLRLSPENLLQHQVTQRYILGSLKELFWVRVSPIPLAREQQLALFHRQLENSGTMVLQSLPIHDREGSTQSLIKSWHASVNLSPRLQTILARMMAAKGCDRYNSLPEIISDFKPLLRIDRIVGEKYRLVRYLGDKGGIKTYLARNIQEPTIGTSLLIVKQFTVSDRDLALKNETSDARDKMPSSVILDKLEHQVRQLQQCFPVQALDLIREANGDRQELYLVRTYIEGISLTKQLGKQQLSSPPEIARLLENATLGLSSIHQQGVIHRNIKASNIIFAKKDRQVVFTDFGILQAIASLPDRKTRSYRQHQPPEQVVGRPTTSSDIYALGMVFCEILTGLPVAEIAQNSAVEKQIWQEKLSSDPALIAIIERMISPNVEKRYQSTEEVLEDLKQKNSKTKVQDRIKRGFSWRNKLLGSFKQPKAVAIAVTSTLCLLGSLELLFPTIRPNYYVYQSKQQSNSNPEKALQTIDKTLQLQPEQTSALTIKGNALLSLQKPVAALETYEKAIAIDPSNVNSWLGKGDVYYSEGEYKQALAAYNKALAIEPQNTVTLAKKGRVLSLLSRYQEALVVQEKALAEDSLIDVELLRDAAESALSLNKNHQALNILNRIQSVAPFKPYLWQNKAIALSKLQQPEEALSNAKLVLESYEKALTTNAGDIKLWLGKGEFLALLNRYEKALTAYDKALSLDPDSEIAWLGISKVFLGMEEYKNALEAVEKALEIEPQSFLAWHARGVILQEQQDLAEAIASHDRAIAINQDYFPAWRDRGTALIAQNKDDRAIKSLQKAVSLAPQDVESWIDLSRALQNSQKIEEALRAIDKAIFLQPRNSDRWLQKAALWEQQQQYTKACDIYRQAMKIAPDLKITGAMQKVGCRS